MFEVVHAESRETAGYHATAASALANVKHAPDEYEVWSVADDEARTRVLRVHPVIETGLGARATHARLTYDPTVNRWYAWPVDADGNAREGIEHPLASGSTPDDALDDLRAKYAQLAAHPLHRHGEIVEL